MTSSTELERNKAVARAVFGLWSSGDLERLDGLVARDVAHHDPYDPTPPRVSPG